MTQRRDFVRLVRQLTVRVETPFFVRHAGNVVQFDAHLPDFGGPNGMVLVLDGMGNFAELSKVASSVGLYFSALNGAAPTSERDVMATLDDWGFYGPDDLRPAWYTGKPWC